MNADDDITTTQSQTDDQTMRIPGAKQCPKCHEQTLTPSSGCEVCQNPDCFYSPCK
jgi:hypothetical protein